MLHFPILEQFDCIEHGVTEKTDTPPECVRGQQVHEDRIAWVTADTVSPVPKTDALLTKTPGVTLGVYTADCVPLIIVEPRAKIIGTIHAGWRGTALEITRKTIEAHKMSPHKLIVAMGPAIAQPHFEVGEEVAAHFPSDVVKRSDTDATKFHIDLWEANKAQCLEMGVQEKNIVVMNTSTVGADNLYSYREGDTDAACRNIAWVRLTNR